MMTFAMRYDAIPVEYSKQICRNPKYGIQTRKWPGGWWLITHRWSSMKEYCNIPDTKNQAGKSKISPSYGTVLLVGTVHLRCASRRQCQSDLSTRPGVCRSRLLPRFAAYRWPRRNDRGRWQRAGIKLTTGRGGKYIWIGTVLYDLFSEFESKVVECGRAGWLQAGTERRIFQRRRLRSGMFFSPLS